MNGNNTGVGFKDRRSPHRENMPFLPLGKGGVG